MVELVGDQGYAATTVAHILERAGRSRRTFYAYFSDRQDCFLAAADEIAERWLDRARVAVERAGERDEDPIAAFVAAIFEEALASPAALRVITVELAALGPPGLDRRKRFLSELAGTLSCTLGVPDAGSGHRLLTQAVAGGVLRVPYARALYGTGVRRLKRTQLLALVPEMAHWIGTYRSKPPPPATPTQLPVAPVGGRAPGTLSLDARAAERLGVPRCESSPSSSFVVHNQRERLLDAIANLSSRRGYHLVTVPEIAREAGVSLQTFYHQFSGREDLLRVAYELGHRKLWALMAHTYMTHREWPSGVRAAGATLLSFLASEPSFAHLALIDGPTAGKLAARAQEGALAYAELFKSRLQPAMNAQRSPQLAAEASAGAIQELCYVHVASRRSGELLDLVDLLAYLALTPFAAS